MIELLIEKKNVDVLQTESIVGEYQVAPIGDISKRVGARSISFKLPKTNNNRAIFESGEIPTSQSKKPYQRLDAKLYVDGVDMGMLFCTLESADDNYNVRLYGGNSDLFTRLKDLKLADLDLDHLNHHWRVESLPFTEPLNTPIKYAIIDYCTDSPNTAISSGATDVYMGCLLPCVYENYLVEKVINEAGYTLDNQILLEPLMTQRTPLIPIGASNDLERDLKFERYLASFAIDQFTPFSAIAAGSLVTMSSIINQTQKYWIDDTTLGNIANNPSTTEFGYFKMPERCKLKIRVRFEYKRKSGGDNPILFRFNIIPNQTPLIGGNFSIQTPYHSDLVAIDTWKNYDETFDVTCLYNASSGLLDCDAIGFAIWLQSLQNYASNWVENKNGIIDILSATPYDLENLIDNKIDYNPYLTNELYFIKSYITVANNLPDFTQADFIKEYMKKFAAIITVDENRKIATIAPFKKVKDQIGQAIDWTGKVDFMETPKTTFSGSYAQQNILKYKDDDTVIKPKGTDSAFYVNDVTLELEKTLIELKYLATESVLRLWDRQIPQMKAFTDYTNFKSFKPRCLLMATENDPIIIRKNLNNTTGQYTYSTNVPYCYFILEGQGYNYGFENNLYDAFYGYIAGVIDKLKIIELPIRLTLLDIATYDFLKPVYIREFDCYFYVNKIKFEYTSTKSATVELIKLL